MYSLHPKINAILEFKICLKNANFDSPTTKDKIIFRKFSQKITNTLSTVAKMASHAIFQYKVLAIDDTHNTWTNICVKMIIIRLIGTRDEKIQNPEEIRSKGPRQR